MRSADKRFDLLRSTGMLERETSQKCFDLSVCLAKQLRPLMEQAAGGCSIKKGTHFLCMTSSLLEASIKLFIDSAGVGSRVMDEPTRILLRGD